MARKFPPSPTLQRRTEQLRPKVELVIACEGRNTEPAYFRACVDYYGAGLVRLYVLPETGVPLTVVQLAVAEKVRRTEAARKQRLGSRPSFSVWAVFDKDEHEVASALALAMEHRVNVAFSNPCFELWPILHIDEYGSQDGRHALQRNLRAVMPTYDHDTGAFVDFEQIKDNFETAHRRATLLNEARIAEECEGGCPSTTVGELVRKIIDNGKIHYRTNR